MGFSGLMGFMGGAARAGEQVADNTLARMDAQSIAQAKAQADMALQERINQYAIQKENRGYKREDFTYSRGLMDAKTKTAEERQFAIDEDKRKFNLEGERLGENTRRANEKYTGSKEKQEGAGKTKAEIKALEAKAGHDNASAKKLLSEIGDGGTKPLTHAEKMAEYKAGKELIDNAYNVTYNAFGIADPSTVKDKAGYSQSLAKLQTKIWGREGLGTEIANTITTGARTEQDNKAKAEADAAAAQAKIDKENSVMGKIGNFFSSDEKPATPNAPKQSTPATKFAPITPQAAPKGKVITAPDGTKYISTGTGLKLYTEPVKQEPVRPVETKKPTGLMGQANTPSNVPVEVDSEVAQAEAELAQAQKEEAEVNRRIKANQDRRKKENATPVNYANESKTINARIDKALANKDFAAADVEYKKLSKAGEIANKQLEIKKLINTLSRLGSGHENDKKDIRARIDKLKAEM